MPLSLKHIAVLLAVSVAAQILVAYTVKNNRSLRQLIG